MMKSKNKRNLIRLLAAAGALCLALAVCLGPDVRAEKQRILVLADGLPEGAVPADANEIGKLLDTVELPDALETRFREGQPVWAELTAPVPGLALTEDGYLLAFTADGDGSAAPAFGFAEMADGLRFAATAENKPLGLRLGEVAVDRDLLIDGRLWHADETGICTLQEAPQQEELDRIGAEYEAAGLAGGLPAERPAGPLPAGFPGTVKPKRTNSAKPAAPAGNGTGEAGSGIPSVGAEPEVLSVGAVPGVPSVGEGSAGGENAERQDAPAPNPWFGNYNQTNFNDYNQTLPININDLTNVTIDDNTGETTRKGGYQEQVLPFPDP